MSSRLGISSQLRAAPTMRRWYRAWQAQASCMASAGIMHSKHEHRAWRARALVCSSARLLVCPSARLPVYDFRAMRVSRDRLVALYHSAHSGRRVKFADAACFTHHRDAKMLSPLAAPLGTARAIDLKLGAPQQPAASTDRCCAVMLRFFNDRRDALFRR
ncbi:hypothetical protein HETIRDRAFT_455289 [Heterobasidion irregulare TC 32-1]|uniref:Uncharacterized protein n=1 Tax=Heterobasidion irregulare (strain TC 32-1) TaxID=747525 RepID=W4JUU6_HETIT|nr:uncharacterized protein HETIRDRAFT_455289 [Heterobasidion irregulare TC 32-1]ETW76850.1 hypothetical protein HETIRDRAFT_455289 [Heterobasidion irregulare TC 32-1]